MTKDDEAKDLRIAGLEKELTDLQEMVDAANQKHEAQQQELQQQQKQQQEPAPTEQPPVSDSSSRTKDKGTRSKTCTIL